MDELLREWREAQEAMYNATTLTHAAIATLQESMAELHGELADLEAPYRVDLARIESAIYDRAVALGATYKAPDIGVMVAYRKGATRVTYDWRAVDSIKATLSDILPATAAALEAARSETTGNPSVTVKLI